MMECFRIILVLLLASTYVVSKPLKTTTGTMVANSEVVVDEGTHSHRQLEQVPNRLKHVEATTESRMDSKETSFIIQGKKPNVALPNHMSPASSELNTKDALSKHISLPKKPSAIFKDLIGEGLPIRNKEDPKKQPFVLTKQKPNIATPNFSDKLKQSEEEDAPSSAEIKEMIKNVPNMDIKDVLNLFNLLKKNGQIKNDRNHTSPASSGLDTKDALAKHISLPTKPSSIFKDVLGEGLPIRKKVDPKKQPFILRKKNSNIATPDFSDKLKQSEEDDAPFSAEIKEMIKNVPDMAMKDVYNIFNQLKNNYKYPTTRRAVFKIENMCCPL